MRLLLFVLVGMVSSCGSAAKQAAAPSAKPAAPRIHAFPLQGYMTSAISLTTGMLIQAKDPALPPNATVTISRSTAPPGTNLMIEFVAAMEGDSQQEVPDVCRVLEHPVEVCEDHGPCATVNPSRIPVIMCSWAFTMEVDALVRIAHDPDRLEALTTSDHAFALELDHIRDGVLPTTDAPRVDENHLSEHWSMLFLFLFAHELRHISEHDSDSAFMDQVSHAQPSLPSAELQAQILCRNSRVFEDNGWSMYRDTSRPRDGDATAAAASPAVRAIVGESNRIWNQEIAADRYAETVVDNSLEFLASRTGSSVDWQLAAKRFRGEFVQDLALIALRSWSMQTTSFISGNCPSLSDSPFALTRCMCRLPARAYRRAAVSLLDANHPPILLRAALVIARQAKQDRSPKLEKWGPLIVALLDGPYKGAMLACLEPGKDTLSRIEPEGSVVQMFPALEGLRGTELKEAPAYPSAREESQMTEECADIQSGKLQRHEDSPKQ